MKAGFYAALWVSFALFSSYATPARAFQATVLQTLPDTYEGLSACANSKNAPKAVQGILAKGEGEHFIIALTGLPQKNFTVKVNGLPQADWVKFEVSRVGWVYVDKGKGAVVHRFDPLFPLDLGQQVSITDNQAALWARISTTADTPDIGSLQFSVEIDSGGKSVVVPVDFQVAPLTLPAKSPLTIQAGLLNVDQSNLMDALSFLSDYGINSVVGVTNITNLKNPDAFYDELFTTTDYKHVRLTFNAVQTQIKACKSRSCISNAIAGWKQSMSELILNNQDLIQKYPNKFIIKAWDEPKTSDYSTVEGLYQFLNGFNLPFMTEITALPKAAISRIASIYIPEIGDIDLKSIRQAQSQGKQVWFYANLMHTMRRPYHTMRNIGWLESSFGLNGYHFWGVNYGAGNPYTVVHNDLNGNTLGEGYFVYPGTGSKIFNSSVRLEMFREGMEDYLIISQVRQMSNLPDVNKKIDSYLSANYKPRAGARYYLNDPKSMHDQILQLISKDLK